MTTLEKFEAAVDVIRNLPKDGPFQPTQEIQLKFYGYYKQAMHGPCRIVKPNFWDLVGRAKWDAWQKVGTMTNEEAMECYVNEMVKIVEDMAYSESVLKFMNVLGLGGMIAVEDLRKKVHGNFDTQEEKENVNVSDSDKEDDCNEFYESTSPEELKFFGMNLTESYEYVPAIQKKQQDYELETINIKCIPDSQSTAVFTKNSMVLNTEINEHLTQAIIKLQDSINDVKKRLNSLELQVNKIPHPKEIQSKLAIFSFGSLSPMAKVLVIMWPFVVQWSIQTVHKRRRFFITNLLVLFQYFLGL